MNRYPLNIEPHNIIIVETILKGPRDIKDIKLVFDTGASITTIPEKISLAIGCDPIKAKKRIEIVTASGIVYAPLVKIPEIEILGFNLKNIEVACLNLPSQSGVSGLLGINILKNFNIALKFLEKILEISR